MKTAIGFGPIRVPYNFSENSACSTLIKSNNLFCSIPQEAKQPALGQGAIRQNELIHADPGFACDCSPAVSKKKKATCLNMTEL